MNNARVFMAIKNARWDDPGVQGTLDAAANGRYFDPKEWCVESTFTNGARVYENTDGSELANDSMDLLTIITRLRTDKAFSRNPQLLSPERASLASLNLIRCGFLSNDRPGRNCAIHIAALYRLRDPMLELLNAGADPLLIGHAGMNAMDILETHHGPGPVPGIEPDPVFEEMMAAMRAVVARREAVKAIGEFQNPYP